MTGVREVDVLLVEDNPGDVRLTREAFEQARLRTELHVVRRGEEALDYLNQQGNYENATQPDIVLLDLNLPGLNGLEVLEEIRETPELKTIPVIILTSSKSEEDIVRSYERHANAYLTKPVNVDKFVNLARTVGDFWLQTVKLPPDNA